MPLPDPLPPDNKSVKICNHIEWWKYIIPLLLLSLILGLMYQDGIIWLIEVWNGNAYSHGYLVPFVSLYLVWEQRKRYQLLPITPAYTAAAIIIIFSLALLLISRSSAFIQLEGASLFFIIPGILLLFFGRQITRAALLPWLYLSFALPWFDLFLNHVQPVFQRLTAIFGTKLLSLIYPVFLTDIYISLPSISMEVARECSGVNFFISVLAIGIPLVYLTQRSWSRAVLVLGLGLLITLLANGFRVAMAGILGENFGPELLHGPAHIFQGWFVAWIGWAGLFIVNWLVIKKSDQNAPRLYEHWQVQPEADTTENRKTTLSLKHIYAMLVLLTLYTMLTHYIFPQPVPLTTPLSGLPKKIANWTGTDAEWLEQEVIFPGEEWRNQEVFFPGADEQLSRIYYSNQSTKPVYLYIAYFNKQTEQKRLISRFSRPLHQQARKIVLQNSLPGTIPQELNQTILTQDGLPYTVFFWYQFPEEKTVTDKNKARMTALQNGIQYQKNNGAVVLVAIPQSTDTTNMQPAPPESVTAFLQDFASPIAKLIP